MTDTELDPRQHQGQFGEAYVRVLATAAGLVPGKPDMDVTGDDFAIRYKGMLAGLRHPRIDVQVKTWSAPVASGAEWVYPMKVEHFNDLAGCDWQNARFLIVVMVPQHSDQYAVVESGWLRLNHVAYFQAFHDQDRIDPRTQSSVRVRIPKANLLTVPRLRELMSTPAPGKAS